VSFDRFFVIASEAKQSRAKPPMLLWIATAGGSRAYPVHTDMRNCMRDEGGPFEAGSQVQVSSHRKLLPSKAVVVSVAEKPGRDPGRQG
jgi:hypothetical protein